jgi:hypothetical protein
MISYVYLYDITIFVQYYMLLGSLIHITCHFLRLFPSTFLLSPARSSHFESPSPFHPPFHQAPPTPRSRTFAHSFSLSLSLTYTRGPLLFLSLSVSLPPSFAQSTRQVTSMSATARFRSSGRKLVILWPRATARPGILRTHPFAETTPAGSPRGTYSYARPRRATKANCAGLQLNKSEN